MSLPNPYQQPLIKAPELARALGIPRSSLYRQIADGRWPIIRTTQHSYVLATAEVYRILGLPIPPAPEAALTAAGGDGRG